MDILREEDSPHPYGGAPCSTNGEGPTGARLDPRKNTGPRAGLVLTVFCSCLAQKELSILEFLVHGYREGGNLCFKLGYEVLPPLLSAEKHLLRERILMVGVPCRRRRGAGRRNHPEKLYPALYRAAFCLSV